MANAASHEQKLAELFSQVQNCRRCALHESRNNVVFGSGCAGAEIMFVGEAPGYHEDQQGRPFVGQAGKLLDTLLSSIGLNRDDVFIGNVLKCRPPGNRDPQIEEITLCKEYLGQQIAIIKPVVICTLGNFSTKLLSGKPDGITRVRGRAQPFPGDDKIRIFPVFHPAAALYTPANLAILENDFETLGEMLASAKSESKVEPLVKETQVFPEVKSKDMAQTSEDRVDPEQLGLF